jgi:hypothetical protein
MRHLACFISAHGFGHAARACAVLQALRQRQPALQITLYTQAPAWFFEQTLGPTFVYISCNADVGVVQSTPLDENLPATLTRLQTFFPFSPARLQTIANDLHGRHADAVLCDISPLGIAAAHTAGLPALLVENFTWDWIYAGYVNRAPGLQAFLEPLHQIFASSDLHIQTEPICEVWPSAHLHTTPAARLPRLSRAEVRRRLRVPDHTPMILLSMGGIPERFTFLTALKQLPRLHFVIPGASETPCFEDNLTLIPHRSQFYHPDLVAACDLLVGKSGYSTIAEACQSNTPFAFISRSNFREAPILSTFIQKHLPSLEILESDYPKLTWLKQLEDLLSQPKRAPKLPNGAENIAKALLEFQS